MNQWIWQCWSVNRYRSSETYRSSGWPIRRTWPVRSTLDFPMTQKPSLIHQQDLRTFFFEWLRSWLLLTCPSNWEWERPFWAASRNHLEAFWTHSDLWNLLQITSFLWDFFRCFLFIYWIHKPVPSAHHFRHIQLTFLYIFQHVLPCLHEFSSGLLSDNTQVVLMDERMYKWIFTITETMLSIPIHLRIYVRRIKLFSFKHIKMHDLAIEVPLKAIQFSWMVKCAIISLF